MVSSSHQAASRWPARRPDAPGSRAGGRPDQRRPAYHRLRTEGGGAGRETAAVGLGVFIGCLPCYGFHLAICWIVGWALRLNRLKMYLSANISNPVIAPWLLLTELQVGAWLRHGSFQSLAPFAIRTTALSVFGADLLVGSVVVGAALAAAAAGSTYALLRASAADRDFADLVRRASDRYVGTSVVAWEFARHKLQNDPVYRAALGVDAGSGSGGTILDIGCGQGLALALLAEARRAFDAGRWPAAWPPPPRFDRMIGIETRRSIAAIAHKALGADAEISQTDARIASLASVRAVWLFDVLQMMGPDEQEALIARAAAALEPGGVILVREADASAGWRFTAVRAVNRLKALALGAWRQRFHFRTQAEWCACFARHGLRAEVQSASDGLPFANLLFRVTAQRRASAPSGPPSPPA